MEQLKLTGRQQSKKYHSQMELTALFVMNPGQGAPTAGTPGISDPGFVIINKAISEGVRVEVIPGACALIAALVLSGLPADKFIFEGFLPSKSTARRKRLEGLSNEHRTIILYESPHRILKTLKDIAYILPDANIVCARELTKIFEEVIRGGSETVLAHFENHPTKGEFIIIISQKIL